MSMDILTIGVGIASFGIFLLIHFLTFRWLRPEELLKSLLACVAVIAVLPVVLMGMLFLMKAAQASVAVWILSVLLALLITGLLSFVYITCIFGPYETSIRMRLVREIARAGGKGISHPELLERYNPKTILDIRLRRLKGSGDVVEQGGLYRTGGKDNFFFFFDKIAGVLKQWIGKE